MEQGATCFIGIWGNVPYSSTHEVGKYSVSDWKTGNMESWIAGGCARRLLLCLPALQFCDWNKGAPWQKQNSCRIVGNWLILRWVGQSPYAVFPAVGSLLPMGREMGRSEVVGGWFGANTLMELFQMSETGNRGNSVERGDQGSFTFLPFTYKLTGTGII